MVARIVASYYQVQVDNTTHFPRPSSPSFSSWTDEREGLLYPGSGEGPTGVVNEYVNVQSEGDDAHSKIARQVAAEAITLVKNEENVLPLKRDGGVASGETFRVGIFGEDAGPGKGPNACKDRGCNQGT
jgi:beta-glucosidase